MESISSGEKQMAEEKTGETHQGGGGKAVASGTSEPERQERHMIPVWFFVGVLLFIYGILIFIKGITEWHNPPETAMSVSNPFYATLSSLHPTFWWGILLIVLGAIFTLTSYPRKRS
jgi:hypothetical protein